MNTTHITKVEIKALWGKYDIVWDNLDPRVNILVGENGSGKSNLLKLVKAINTLYAIGLAKNIIFDYAICNFQNKGKLFLVSGKNSIKNNGKDKQLKEFFSTDFFTIDLDILNSKSEAIYYHNRELNLRAFLLQTFENKFHNPTDTQDIIGKEVQTNLDLSLWQLEKDFKSYQSKILNQYRREKDEKIFAKSDLFKQLMNDFFSVTYKNIEITDASDIFIEQTDEYTNEKLRLSMYDLSSGEKQLLIILLTALLSNNENIVLLLDEPEVSLHIGWQQKLIDSILELNENCQLIIATHSPSIFGKSWGKHVTFMKNIKYATTKNSENNIGNKETITQ